VVRAEHGDEYRLITEAMAVAQDRGDEREYTQGNRRFHQQVKEAAHQKTLARAYDNLLYPLVMRQYRDLAPRTRGKDHWKSTRRYCSLLSHATRIPPLQRCAFTSARRGAC
jgi:DNA-binding GntR family transcriptional regulator